LFFNWNHPGSSWLTVVASERIEVLDPHSQLSHGPLLLHVSGCWSGWWVGLVQTRYGAAAW